MGNLKLRWRWIAQVMVCSAAAFLMCGTPLAQGATPVNGFVVINPIVVCNSGGSGCAAYGMSCTSASGSQVCTQSPAPSSATTTTPIGFVDTDKNVNLTRAFWAQAGIDVVFFPIKQYNSPSSTIPSSWSSLKDAINTTQRLSYLPGDYTQLHQVNVLCGDGITIVLASPDFQALTQHSVCSDHGGLGPGYTSLASQNPPPAPSPAPPLAINGCGGSCSINSNALDVFFVNKVVSYPGSSSTINGFSWINGDGETIVGAGLGNIFLTSGPRFDTLAHETGHNLALDHMTYGANTDTVNPPGGNMMLLGTSRFLSAKSGCQASTTTPACSGTSCSGGALYDLDYTTSTFDPCMGSYSMLADHLTNTGGTCTTPPCPCTDPTDRTTCTNQEAVAAISPFINSTAPNTANAGGGQAFLANAATTSTTTSTGTSTALQITITADGNPNDTSVPDLASTIIALLPSDPLSFNGSHPVTQIGGTPINPNVTCDANNLQNCAVTVTDVTKLSNQQVTGNPGCDSGSGQPPSAQCVRITYSVGPSNGFGPDNPACQVPPSPPGGCVFPPPASSPGIFVILAVSFNKDAGTIISQGLLTGAQYTSIDANGFATTTLFAPAAGGFIADSGNPDLTTANVLLDPSKFQNASAVKFGSPPFNNRKLAQCTQPFTTVNVKIKGQVVQQKVCPDGSISRGPD
jgi:hypothetical protein